MAYFDKYGVEFSDDRKTLVKCPEDFRGEYIIPNGVTRIEERAFFGCESMTDINISNSVTSIGNEAFSYCSSLMGVDIPNSVTSIEDYVFAYCNSLIRIVIPRNVTLIGFQAFEYCPNLTSIIVENENTSYDSRDNCNAIIEKATNELIVGCKNTIIPISVTSIGGSAFVGCYGLTTIVIPNNVTSIRQHAFQGCHSLTGITMPYGITYIGEYAFAGCKILKEIIVPKGQKARFARMAGLKDLKDKIVEASMEDQKLRTWEEVNAEYRAYFERRQKENPNIQNKNGGTPLEFPPFGIELSLQEYSQFKKEGRTIHSWMFWCKSGNEIHELARLYGPIGGIGLYTPRKGYYKVVGIEGEGNDARLVCYYNLFSSNEFLEEEDEKVRVKQKPLFNKRSSCAGPIEIGDIVHVKSTELVEDIFDGRTYQAYKIKWEFV